MGAKKKVKSKHGSLSTEMIHRIDNMDKDEYNPYKPQKKSTLTSDDLFNELDYIIEEEESNEGGVGYTIVLIVLIVVMILLGFSLYYILKQ